MSFSIKSGCTLGCGSGIGAGGVVAHQNSIPYTWEELLTREGVVFLSRLDDYYGIFYDQKTDLDKEKVTESTTQVKEGSEKIRAGCQKELSSSYVDEKEFEKKKKNILNFCTVAGITTLKGKLGQISQIDGIEEENNNKEESYQIVFAIYRHSPDFLNWLNADKKNGEQLNTGSKPSEKYTDLKTKCTTTMALKIEKVSNIQDYAHVAGGCQKLPYKKVEDKLKADVPGGKKRNDGESAAAIGNNVSEVKNAVKGSDKSSEDPDKSKYQSGCTTTLDKSLKEDEVFQKEYKVALTICSP